MKRLVDHLFLLSFVLLFSCQSQHMIHYGYADGSGNVYLIKNDSIRYDPVTPRNSSSGTYSGGEPASAPLSADQKKELEQKIDQVFRNKDNVIENRIMTSGQLVVYEGEKQKEKIIVKRSSGLTDFENWLKSLLGK